MTTEKQEQQVTDLAQLNTEVLSDEGAWLTLEHPITGAPLSARIKLAGIDSKVYQKQIRKNQDKRLKRFRFKTSSDELENERLALLTAITLTWEDIAEGKQVLECIPANVRHIYTKYLWIREQVDEFAGDRANFIKN
jgi:hypothetical protein